MNIEDISAQLEEEMTWRQDEIRFFRNQLVNITDPDKQKIYRKALVVMLYSHYEGFCKIALSIYAKAINSEHLFCLDTTDCIVAASLANVFRDYENPFKKSVIFKASLPDDSNLHRFSRQADLISSLAEIWKLPVDIPVDEVVDTESNLWPKVLSKILYRLGFKHDTFQAYESDIRQLINRRHDIAHGKSKTGLEYNEYNVVEKATYLIMNELKNIILKALRERNYIRPTPVSTR